MSAGKNLQNDEVTTNDVSREELNRLAWHSRRGMLELDILLVPFTQEVFPQLSAEDQGIYKELLDCEDADLFVWFMEKEKPEDPRFAAMVGMIIERVRSLHSSH